MAKLTMINNQTPRVPFMRRVIAPIARGTRALLRAPQEIGSVIGVMTGMPMMMVAPRDEFEDWGAVYEAIKLFKENILLDPPNAQTYYGLGLAYYHKGQYDLAIAAFQNSTQVNPDHFEAQSMLAFCYLQKKQYDVAIENFKRAISIKQDDFAPYIGLGVAYHQTGQYELAIAAFQKALELKPDLEEAKKWLAQAVAGRKKY